jgi:hypothetical protein
VMSHIGGRSGARRRCGAERNGRRNVIKLGFAAMWGWKYD